MPALYPTLTGGPPTLPDGSEIVSRGPATFRVLVHLGLSSTAFLPGKGGVAGPVPSDMQYMNGHTLITYMSAAIVENGDLLAIGINGEIPAEYNGSLITVGATVIEPELFTQGVGPQRPV